MSSTKFLKLKKRSLIYYSLPDQRRYNENSKKNLMQYENQICPIQKKEIEKIKNECSVDNINTYSKGFILKYRELMKKEYKVGFSQTQVKKIADSTNTFIDIVKYNYKKSKGLNQRMITFVTLTISQDQKHTDKILVKTLVDFIDHLKKVKNTLIENKIDTKTELLKLENYVWRAETTERGNIHFHLLFDTYVNHITLKRVWNNYLSKLGYEGGENSANIHNLRNIKDVGSYVTKYLTKEPLNDEFSKLLKDGKISRDDLSNYDNETKYRRPVLYTSWGCSRALKTLKAPTFTGAEILDFEQLKNKCQKVELNDDLKDYIKIYKGKIYDLLNSCSYTLKSKVKNRFKILFSWLYEKTDQARKEMQDLIDLHRVDFTQSIIPQFAGIKQNGNLPYQSSLNF